MRRITLLLLLFTSSLVFGQDADMAKKWVLGGNFNFSSQTVEDADGDESTLSNFELQPYLGYMLNEDWTLGVRLAYLNRSSEFGDSESTDKLIGFGVFSRYKFVKRSNWALFAEPELIVYSGSSEGENFLGDVESDLSGMQVGVGLGGYYQISPMWRFTVGIGSLGYATETEDFDGAEETSSAFGLDMGLNTIRVGMEITF